MRQIHLESCGSTMDEAGKLAREGAEHLTLVTADEQTKGRGRQGKAWRTFAEESFAGSFVVREGVGQHLALVISLAVLEVCKILNPKADLEIKWPNDILKGGKKIAGILVEQGEKGEFAVVGVGLNIGRIEGLEADFMGDFLLDKEHFSDKMGFVEMLGGCVAEHLHLYSEHGWAAFAAPYQEACKTIGQRVVWEKGTANELYGDAIGLNDDGALMLKDEKSGEVRLIHAGEIIAQGKVL